MSSGRLTAVTIGPLRGDSKGLAVDSPDLTLARRIVAERLQASSRSARRWRVRIR